jgi:hypothetical protein
MLNYFLQWQPSWISNQHSFDFQSTQFKNIHFVEDPKRNIQASFHLYDSVVTEKDFFKIA